MDARMMEVLVFVDGIDAMTSKAMQARRSYQPSEMAMNQQVRQHRPACMQHSACPCTLAVVQCCCAVCVVRQFSSAPWTGEQNATLQRRACSAHPLSLMACVCIAIDGIGHQSAARMYFA
jgi:cytochrome c5